MTPEALEFLCCPSCGGELKVLNAVQGAHPRENGIFAGRLGCGCGREFEIQGGVPILLSPESMADPSTRENLAAWDEIWKRARAAPGGYFTSENLFEEDFGIERGRFNDATVLEIGCGTGKYLSYILSRSARWLFACDISDTICDTYARLAPSASGRLCLVRCDLSRPPFRPGSFDLVLGARVLHHLPDMAGSYRQLLRLTRPGGTVATAIYRRVEGSDMHIRALERAKPLLRRCLGQQVLFLLAAIPAALVILCARLIYVPLSGRPRLISRLPLHRLMLYWAKCDFQSLWRYIIFDILAAPKTRYTSEAELRELSRGLPLERLDYRPQHEAIWSVRMVRLP